MSKKAESRPKTASPRSLIFFGIVVAFLAGGVAGFFGRTSQNFNPETDAVKVFLNGYFKTWSARDMQGYENCFDDSAMIYFIKNGQVVLRQDKPDFIAGQTEAIRLAPGMEEHPESMDIQVQDDVAYARVYWKLTKGGHSTLGYDHFILLRMPRGWQILSLSFYELPEKH